MILINFVLTTTDLKLNGSQYYWSIYKYLHIQGIKAKCWFKVSLLFYLQHKHTHTPMNFDYLRKTLPRDSPTRNAVVVLSNKLVILL